MTQTKTSIEQIKLELVADLKVVHDAIKATGNKEAMDALAGVITFSTIGMRVIARTNPSKVRDITRTVLIASHMAGVEMVHK